MRLQIFNVGHGFCALLTADNNNVILFDCGHNDSFRPSIYLPRTGCRALEMLVITNFDHDHVSDLHNVRSVLPIQALCRNRSLSPETLLSMKLTSGPLSDGLRSAIDIHGSYIHPVASPLDFGGLEYRFYYNNYPTFTDTNNLSLVTFLFYAGLGIVIPGDLEQPGWKELLKGLEFRADLQKTKIFVASHHGRESGYCEEVFSYCRPDVILISDEAMQYETQEVVYGPHASGVAWSDGSTRRALTTRSDGHVTITKQQGQGYRIRTSTATLPCSIHPIETTLWR